MYCKSVATPVPPKSSWLEWRGEGKERNMECKNRTTKLFGELKILKKGKKRRKRTTATTSNCKILKEEL